MGTCGSPVERLRSVDKISVPSNLQGEVSFEVEKDEAKVKGSLKQLSQLLSVSPEALKQALCHRVIAAGGEVMQKGHTVSEAIYGRDAFAKACSSFGNFFV